MNGDQEQIKYNADIEKIQIYWSTDIFVSWLYNKKINTCNQRVIHKYNIINEYSRFDVD